LGDDTLYANELITEGDIITLSFGDYFDESENTG